MTSFRSSLFFAGLLAALLGALKVLAFSPFEIWPLACVTTAMLFVLLERRGWRNATLIGYCFGLGLYGAGVSWIAVSIHVYGNAPLWLAGLLMSLFILGVALFFAMVTALSAWLIGDHSRQWVRFMGFACIFILGEWFRGTFLTGFPWLQSGTALEASPLSGFAPIGGLYFLGILVMVCSGLLLQLVCSRSTHQRLLCVAALLGLGFSGSALQEADWTQVHGEPLQALLVQPDVPQELKWVPAYRETQIEQLQGLTKSESDVDLVLWPEAALPLYRHQAADFLGDLHVHHALLGQTLISGILDARPDPSAEGSWQAFNSLVVLGRGEGIYHKQKLVPFGEYVPLQEWLRGIIGFFDLPMSTMSRGASEQPLLSAAGFRFAALICYEVVYPELTARIAPDSHFLVTVSNDTWFGTSIGPLQHLQMARLRALASRKPMLRATNNGVSTLISHKGEQVYTLPRFEQASGQVTLQPRSGQTPLNIIGPHAVLWPLLGCVLWLAQGRLRRHRDAFSRFSKLQ